MPGRTSRGGKRKGLAATASANPPSFMVAGAGFEPATFDRKSTRLNSSHSQISYAVFCLKKKKKDACDVSLAGATEDYDREVEADIRLQTSAAHVRCCGALRTTLTHVVSSGYGQALTRTR